jgi:hypothetical protein
LNEQFVHKKCATSKAPAILRHAIIHDESPVCTIIEI